MGMKSLKELTGINSKVMLEVGDKPLLPNEGRQIEDPDYVWRPDLVRDMLVFWTLGVRAMILVGPKGSGKTTLPEQWHVKLNKPMWTITGNKNFTVDELFGQFLPNKEGGMDWHDGPVLRAARAGGSVLINELNAIPPGVTVALNDIAQPGSAMTVPQTGETIFPAPGFRLFMTMNPPDSLYVGRHQLDPSTLDRPYKVFVDFMPEDEEKAHLRDVLEASGVDAVSAIDYADKMVQVAKAVRATSMDVSKKADAIPETMSTRVLRSWARYWVALQNQPSAVHRALERALTFTSNSVVSAAIHGHVTTIFGVPFKTAPAVLTPVKAAA